MVSVRLTGEVSSMKRWVQVVCLSMALLIGLVGPSLSVWRLHQEEADAQAGAIAAEIATVCVGSLFGAAVCTAVVTYIVTGWIASGGVPPWEMLQDGIGAIADWIEGDGTAVNQMVAQIDIHPRYIDVTPEMLSEWQALLFELGIEGWEFKDFGAEGVIGLPGPMTATIESEGASLWPTIGDTCVATYVNYYVARQTGDQWNAKLRAYNTTDSPASLIYSANISPNQTLSAPGSDTVSAYGLGSLGSCSDYGDDLLLTLEAVNSGESGDYWTGLAYVKVQVTDADHPAVGHTTNVQETAFVAADVAILDMLADSTINRVLDADDLYTWDGVSDLPLADGTTGAVIEGVAPSPVEEPDWWEGLFGGVTGWLGKIWDTVQDIAGDVANVMADVAALPVTMVGAIADAFVPTESVSERTDDLRTSFSGKAPFAWPAIIFGVVGDLFEGGSACPEIQLPAASNGNGWAPVDLEMCLPDGAQTILYVCWDVAAASLVMVWGYWVYRRLVGS